MKRLILLVAVALAIAPLAGFAQTATPADTLLDRLTGKWLLKGVIDGKNIQHDISAEWVLGRQYLELKETSHEQQSNGLPVYDAMVFICFDKKLQQYNCLWLDNTSNAGIADHAIIAHAKFKADTIALLFSMSSKNLFRTTFTFNPNKNTWHWEMKSDEDGKITEFANAEMSKLD